MNFVPSQDQLRLWDTWIYVAPKGEIHLFYLANKPGGAWGYVGHAVSTDWVTWSDLPEIRLTGEPGAWDDGASGTGMVFRHDDGRCYMTYTGALSRGEAGGLLVSSDLITWEKCSVASPCWPRCGEEPYERENEQVAASGAWRDPYVTRDPQGRLIAVCSARLSGGPAAGRACFASAQLTSLDGWVTGPPLAHTGRYASMEVPEIFPFEDRWWALFSTGSNWGVRLDTPSRDAVTGTFFLSSETWDGVYGGPPENLLLGSGGNRMDAYVARQVTYEGLTLIYHHYAGSPTAFGLPKELKRDGEALYLAPWTGVERLHRPVERGDWMSLSHGSVTPGIWMFSDHRAAGDCRYGSDAALRPTGCGDLDVEVQVVLRRGRRAGIGIVTPDVESRGVAVLLDSERGEVTLTRCDRWQHGCGMRLDDRIDVVRHGVRKGIAYRLRLMRRGQWLECFVNGRLMFASVLPDVGPGGAVASVLESGAADFHWDRIHRLAPLNHQPTIPRAF